ncbi:sensor histidine kinase [Salinicoccus sp. ID82-1]|uniref:histidine kinase n=1 Tax=Salinicoccus cyprini TaxID=2493691 RepID=A0A558AQW7_9STAP|nr:MULTISPECIES: sensor histidine kinase [Salinicoccus]MCG1010283.1 sensor histidine kinase [Salinicoccus sp. ID82-1]TVT26663.1 sensor histidine kinase [Salinicoccus cyprini]
MRDWYHIFPKNTGLSLYIWIIFCVLPFYFIFRSTSLWEIVFGIIMTMLFFTVSWLTFNRRGPLIYIGLSIEFAINIVMTVLYSYVYFALFVAFFIGNISSKAGFISMYVIHLVTTVTAITFGFFYNYTVLLVHLPFLIMTVLGVILVPINQYNRLKQEALESKLEDANLKIAELAIVEERHRIARDLHDTLGQKLSMIGLKSELSRKLIDKDAEAAKHELEDIQSTSRQALKEVREMISDMKEASLENEIEHVKKLMDAAQIRYDITTEGEFKQLPVLVENVLSMCLKEAVTNVVKHSQAQLCVIEMIDTNRDILMKIMDNGEGDEVVIQPGHGLQGMKERLSFVNGALHITNNKDGFEINITVPKVLKQIEEE